MNLTTIARANLRGSAVRYAAFVLSSVFSVALFYLYAQLAFHPVVRTGDLFGGSATRTAVTVCLYLIALFSTVFITYSTTTFIKNRGTEFGLLALFGAERRQLGRLVAVEQSLLGALSLGIGLAAGMLFSHLFNLVFARVVGLDTGLSFAFHPTPIILTVAGFAAVFALVSMFATRSLQKLQIVEQLRHARMPKPLPRGNVFLLLLGFLLVGGGYGATFLIGDGDAGALLVLFFPVVIVTTLGTYLLFSQLSLVVLRFVRRLPSYYRGTRMIVVAQLAYRLRDNARLLASVSILSAVVFSAAGTFYAVMSAMQDGIASQYPVNVQQFSPSNGPDAYFSVVELENLFTEYRVKPHMVNESLVVHRSLTNDHPWIISDAYYSAVTGRTLTLAPGDARLLSGGDGVQLRERVLPDGAQVTSTTAETIEQDYGVQVTWYTAPLPFNTFDPVFVVPEQTFTTAFANALEEEQIRVLLATYDRPPRAFVEEFKTLVPHEFVLDYANRDADWLEITSTLALSMFVGVFVSLLFLIGAGSAIYFKLFTDITSDRETYAALHRIGFTEQEFTRTATQQIAVLFFLPFLVGALHSAVALSTLGRTLGANFFPYIATILALFFVVQVAFVLLTRLTYVRAVRPAPAA